ncbi:MAG: FKBP-type peptidyl-prolyl cis-trans isomerase [Candidatus Bathyarchaeota archaeon B26-2]|nr:MAG: FKBP-type peptidyl-prolyl cis-trans isomerase [Candidatus Bathyarchaeota archaeon B26-2]
MPFKKGDFVLVDYVAKVVETGEVFDTTIEDVARKEGIYKEGALYEPMLVVLGEGWVLKALDESLTGLELNQKANIEIPPEKAFGLRDPEKVKLYPLRRLRARGIRPQVGMRIEVDGRLATVRTIGSGRVQLDFNPPLAGKTIAYEVTVKKVLETEDEKIRALVHRRIPSVEIEKFDIEVGETEVTINIPEEAFYVEGLQISKRGIWMDLQKFFPEKKTLKFVEVFKSEPSGGEPSSKESSTGSGGSR